MIQIFYDGTFYLNAVSAVNAKKFNQEKHFDKVRKCKNEIVHIFYKWVDSVQHIWADFMLIVHPATLHFHSMPMP